MKKAMLSVDNTLVDENNLEIPQNSIIYCLGLLFQVTNAGLRHIVGKKIDNDTYFVNSELYRQLNELAFVEQSDVRSTPDAAPKKEGLLASAYKFMTAPFLVRTPSNVTTHNRQRKSSPNKLVCIDNLATSAESNISPNTDNILKIPIPQEITRLDARCKKAITNEVKFFICSYKNFMTCENEKLQSVINALNAANVDRYNEVRIQYPGFIWDPPVIDINKLVMLVQSIYLAQVVEYSLGHGKKSDSDMKGNDKHRVEETAGLFPPSKPKADNNKYDESFREFNVEQSIDEVNDGDRKSHQPLDRNSHNCRSRSRSPEDSTHRKRHRYEVLDRRYRHDSYTGRSDSGYNNQLTSSQCLEVKLFLDKISYFNGWNNKEALNFLAQCEEAAEKMKASEVTIAWSKLAGRADRIMREETRQHEGTLTWDLFQSMLIEHFYHILSKERAASLLNKLQQNPHENIGEYMQRGSKIIQVHSGKTNLKEIAASQYGWNLVQGLTNIPIKNKIADHISLCQSLSDVCKLVKQVKREMENREAFTGISVETEESVEEINWRQYNYNQRERGNNRGKYRGNYHQTNYGSQGRGYKNGYNSGYSSSGHQTGNSSLARKVGNATDVQCLLCELKVIRLLL